jgi:hypothetical protein
VRACACCHDDGRGVSTPPRCTSSFCTAAASARAGRPPRPSPLPCPPRARLQRDVDVFNALDLMENAPSLLKELKFGPGDGHLQYYLYNWRCPEMEPADVGLVLL